MALRQILVVDRIMADAGMPGRGIATGSCGMRETCDRALDDTFVPLRSVGNGASVKKRPRPAFPPSPPSHYNVSS